MTDALRDAWLSGRADILGARGEAFAWALRKAWHAQGNGEYGLLKFVHEKISKPDGAQPQPDALQLLFKRIDTDDEWYPGKISDTGGRPRAMLGTNEAVFARSLMAYKRNGGELTHAMAIAMNPNATRNLDTGEPVNKKSGVHSHGRALLRR